MDEYGDMSRHLFLDFTPMKSFSQEPVVYARGEGVRLFDTEGRAYWDGLSGIFVANLGHANPNVIQAIKDQVEQLTFHPPLAGVSEAALRLGQKLAEITPANLTAAKLLNSGSEATESAIKMARQYFQMIGKPNKRKVLSRYRSWHGSTFGALSMSGTAESKVAFEPLMPEAVDDRWIDYYSGLETSPYCSGSAVSLPFEFGTVLNPNPACPPGTTAEEAALMQPPDAPSEESVTTPADGAPGTLNPP